MIKVKEEILVKAMDRAIQDNARAAEQNKKKAILSGEPIIDPTVSKRFLNVIRDAAGKNPL